MLLGLLLQLKKLLQKKGKWPEQKQGEKEEEKEKHQKVSFLQYVRNLFSSPIATFRE